MFLLFVCGLRSRAMTPVQSEVQVALNLYSITVPTSRGESRLCQHADEDYSYDWDKGGVLPVAALERPLRV